MSWWILGPLLYGIGGFITLVGFIVVSNLEKGGKKFDINDQSQIEASLGVFAAWPLIALLLLACGGAYVVVRGAHALADWLKDAAK